MAVFAGEKRDIALGGNLKETDVADLPLSLRYRSIIRGAQVPADDAREVLSAAYKAASDAGLHLAALKLCCKLSRQDPSKATAFLEAFDEYRADFGLDDQEQLPFSEEGQEFEATDAEGNVQKLDAPRRSRVA